MRVCRVFISETAYAYANIDVKALAGQSSGANSPGQLLATMTQKASQSIMIPELGGMLRWAVRNQGGGRRSWSDVRTFVTARTRLHSTRMTRLGKP